MTLANRLTLARIALAGLFFAFMLAGGLWARVLATTLFLLASATDWLDGLVARRTGTTSEFGALADPLADKLLVLAALVIFLALRELDVPAWVIFLTIARELVIGSLRALAALKGRVLAAERWGKWKMGVQTGCILAILVLLTFRTFVHAYPSLFGPPAQRDRLLLAVHAWPRYLSYLILLASLSSGVWYLRRNWELIQESSA